MTTRAILPHIGFGNVKFGMEEHEVSSLIGDPDETEIQNYGDGGEANVLYYDDLGLSMSFDNEEQFKLVEISFENEAFVLHGTIKVGMLKEDFLKALENLEMGDYDSEKMDDEGFENMEQLTFEKENVNVWIEGDKVSTIQIGPEFVDDETIRWPAREITED
ncbi:hypothetical protein [Carboxylicivirga sp. N1Y90]|uniref:hypothetical protein n=1 Tax=Carboxylicivirga fragile TaxID=3417571 RepID=UPI003D331786|nr:hypothetical protein [Marinilabiliaceae bacterium N1Y90]